MAEYQQELVPYGVIYSKKANAALRTLPQEAKLALGDFQALLTEDPKNFPYPNRLRPKGEKSFVYIHPEPPLEVTYELDEEQKPPTIYFLHVAARELREKKPLFIAYSHRDKEWLDELLTWLSDLERKRLIDIWQDRMIEPGENWQDKIEQALTSAKAAVLLVTPHFLASRFVYEVEMPAVMEAYEGGRLRLMWIAVRHSTYDQTPLCKIQALNVPEKPLNSLSEAERDAEFRKIHGYIKRALES